MLQGIRSLTTRMRLHADKDVNVMVTMKKIAELCGVSRGTVDRALNGRGRVNAETAAMIRKMAKQLGYEPNPAGKALAARKNNPVIGVLLPSEGNAFFDDVIHGMDLAASSYAIYGLKVRYYLMKGYDVEKQLALMESMRHQVNALIISPIDDPRIAAAIDSLVADGIFVITVVSDIDSSQRRAYVGSDYFNGGETACALLEILLGKKASVGLVMGSRQVLGHRLRLEGFRHRMERLPDFTIAGIVENGDDEICSYERTKELLQEHPDISAMFCMAGGVYGVCRAVMQLPEEKQPLVIAFDSVPTTVEMMRCGIVKAILFQHPTRQGRLSVQLAFEYLVNGRLPDKTWYLMKNEIRLLENL